MNNDDLLKLQKQWYKKLKDEGFDDIEDFGIRNSLNGMDTPYIKGSSYEARTAYREDVLEYYMACEDLYWRQRFPSQLHRFLWYWHSQGYSTRELSDKYSAAINKYLSHVTIWKIINTYKPLAMLKIKQVLIPKK